MYIGKIPATGAFQKCDNLSASGTADYTLQVGSVNVVPESVNHMIVSLNGVIQSPTTAFTVSGAVLSFASALTSNDTIDFVILLGNVLDIGVPSDDSCGAAQIKDDLISGTTALTLAPAATDEFLVSDAGTLKRIDYNVMAGVAEVDHWRITADFVGSGSGNKILTANWERADSENFAVKGTGMTESSGIFTFPSTGYWLIATNYYMKSVSGARTYVGSATQITTNNSSYETIASTYGSCYVSGAFSSPNITCVFRNTDTSNCKARLVMEGEDSITTQGGTDDTKTGVTFIKLAAL